VGWGIPTAKCTLMGALSSSNRSSILSALFWVIKLWEAPIVFAGLEGIHVVAILKIVPHKMSSSYMVIHQIKFRMQK
jgi:hypothetical protein